MRSVSRRSKIAGVTHAEVNDEELKARQDGEGGEGGYLIGIKATSDRILNGRVEDMANG
jgi:hypothetical protein